jgi:ATP-binding protein involved in chromosome partitioning
MLGVQHRPTQVESMIMPPSAHGVKVISIGMFTKDNTPVVWRGPMLHRALQQFLSDVYWGDLDVLLMDLPPGTGDVAISVAQLVPSAEILVVTTPQLAAQEVAERAGSIALQTHQRIAGVVENMSYLECPHCDERIDVFGSGGGPGRREQPVAAPRRAGAAARPGADRRAAARGRRQRRAARAVRPDGAASATLLSVSDALTGKPRGLAGMSLGLSPARR